ANPQLHCLRHSTQTSTRASDRERPARLDEGRETPRRDPPKSRQARGHARRVALEFTAALDDELQQVVGAKACPEPCPELGTSEPPSTNPAPPTKIKNASPAGKGSTSKPAGPCSPRVGRFDSFAAPSLSDHSVLRGRLPEPLRAELRGALQRVEVDVDD